MKTIRKWQAVDETIFEDERACLAHELLLAKVFSHTDAMKFTWLQQPYPKNRSDCFVYIWTRGETTLYVGSTHRVHDRFIHHNNRLFKDKLKDGDAFSFMTYPSIQEARESERAFIRLLKPKYGLDIKCEARER